MHHVLFALFIMMSTQAWGAVASMSVEMDENTSSTINLTVKGRGTLSVYAQAQHGTAVLDTVMQTVTYTPDADFVGTDSFVIRQTRRFAVSDATITIVVNNVNAAPQVIDLSYNMDEDSSQNIVLAATDEDGDELVYTIVDQPQHGVLSGEAPDLTYTPDPDYFGEDSFSYLANDGKLDSGEALVSITINDVVDPINWAAQWDTHIRSNPQLYPEASGSSVDSSENGLTSRLRYNAECYDRNNGGLLVGDYLFWSLHMEGKNAACAVDDTLTVNITHIPTGRTYNIATESGEVILGKSDSEFIPLTTDEGQFLVLPFISTNELSDGTRYNMLSLFLSNDGVRTLTLAEPFEPYVVSDTSAVAVPDKGVYVIGNVNAPEFCGDTDSTTRLNRDYCGDIVVLDGYLNRLSHIRQNVPNLKNWISTSPSYDKRNGLFHIGTSVGDDVNNNGVGGMNEGIACNAGIFTLGDDYSFNAVFFDPGTAGCNESRVSDTGGIILDTPPVGDMVINPDGTAWVTMSSDTDLTDGSQASDVFLIQADSENLDNGVEVICRAQIPKSENFAGKNGFYISGISMENGDYVGPFNLRNDFNFNQTAMVKISRENCSHEVLVSDSIAGGKYYSNPAYVEKDGRKAVAFAYPGSLVVHYLDGDEERFAIEDTVVVQSPVVSAYGMSVIGANNTISTIFMDNVSLVADTWNQRHGPNGDGTR